MVLRCWYLLSGSGFPLSAWACRTAGVRHHEGKALRLHAGPLPPLWGLSNPKGMFVLLLMFNGSKLLVESGRSNWGLFFFLDHNAYAHLQAAWRRDGDNHQCSWRPEPRLQGWRHHDHQRPHQHARVCWKQSTRWTKWWKVTQILMLCWPTHGWFCRLSLHQWTSCQYLVVLSILCTLFARRFGVRFPCMSDAYDRDLQQLAMEVGQELGYGDFLKEGVYCVLGGPSFETIAECRMLHLLGADAVGE